MNLWIESIDLVYGLSLWIETMDLVNGEIGLQSLYGLSPRSESGLCLRGILGKIAEINFKPNN